MKPAGVSQLKPFFCYYGGKYRNTPYYPAPMHSTIVEPFAGSAGYATRHNGARVILAEADPLLLALWRYLIRVRRSEIEALPSVVRHVDDVRAAQEAKWLIGFWLNKGTTSPRKSWTIWCDKRPNSNWGDVIKERIASQVEMIRHWEVIDGGYEAVPDVEATWFIDPPYSGAKSSHYKHRAMDYGKLSDWCHARRGQVIVCEHRGASWLPFQVLGSFKATPGHRKDRGFSSELIYSTGV